MLKIISKQILITTALFSVIYLLPIYFLSEYFEPEPGRIDICFFQERGDHSSLGIYGYKLIESKKPKIMLLGASGVMHGMRPNEFEEEFPGYQSANLAVSGTNISGIWEMLDASRTTIPKELLPKSEFIIGVFFGTFIENRVRYQKKFRHDDLLKPDCKEGIVKHGFYKFDGQEVVPKYPTAIWKTLVKIARPTKIIARMLEFTDEFYQTLFELPKYLINRALAEELTSEQIILRQAKRDKAINFWPEFMDRPQGDLADEQFEVLIKLSEYAEKYNLNVTIVDLPIAHWHLEKSPLYKDYQIRKEKFFTRAFNGKHLRYIDLQDLNADEYFTDSVHVHQKYTSLWSKEIRKRWEQQALLD